MCGIAGIISPDPRLISKDRLQRMSDAIAHRGPDGAGVWIDAGNKTGFSHRRLAILDLSDAASQPMHYAGRYTIVYNGEIYNYIELRQTLSAKGYHFRSTGDTEVILAAYACYGRQCLDHFDGMFAFAIWDMQEETLFAARDRFGEKPFFYFEGTNEFLFASEMKSLWAAGLGKQMDNTMLLNYLTMGIATHPLQQLDTFYNSIKKLPPAHCLYLTGKGLSYECSITSYWQPDKQAITALGEEDCIQQFKALLTSSVKNRLRSDVPVGTSVSGGLDSSSIVAIMQSLLPAGSSAASFSALFPGFEKDESAYIKLITNKYHLKNYPVIPTADDFIGTVKKICHHQEEPFSSSSVYAQYKVYEAAKDKGTGILLDGQGADEIMAGYHKYYHWYWQQLIKEGSWNTLRSEIRAVRKEGIPVNWGIKNYFAAYMPQFTARQLEKRAYIIQRHQRDIEPDFFRQFNDRRAMHKPVVKTLNDILYFNTMQGGLEELLRYADRNSMAHSREVRLPFLQHELVQFIFSLPPQYKIRKGFTKWILRTSMQNELPDAIVWRKDKTGFEPPQYRWMQQPVWQDYIHECKKALVERNILKPACLKHKPIPRAAHEAGNYDFRYLVTGAITGI